MNTKLLMLKIAATLATLIAGGCEVQVSPVPNPVPAPSPTPDPVKVEVEVKVVDGKLTVNDATIDLNLNQQVVESTVEPVVVAQGCNCPSGCNQVNCNCSHRTSAKTRLVTPTLTPPKAQTEKRPVVRMIVDQSFRNGGCLYCRLAEDARKLHGKSWPFELVIEYQANVRLSPTFVFPDGRTVTGWAGEAWLLQQYAAQ